MILALLIDAAGAADVYDSEQVDLALGGDIKTFFLATFPYDHLIFLQQPYDPEDFDDPEPEVDPSGQGVADLRLKLEARGFGWLKFKAHAALTGQAPKAAGGLASTGVGAGTEQAVDLTWEGADAEGLALTGRVDWLSLSARGKGIGPVGVDLTLGRQPITFGKALFFTPMDLVNPFNPAVIDQEYKPGVDAARLDLYAGMATQLTLAAAYAGDWDLSGMVLAAYGQTTLGVWDLGLFAASAREDRVLGLTTAGSLGPVGVRAEITGTDPAPEDEDPFVRAAAGGDWRPGEKTTLSGEIYFQSFGVTDPHEYLAALSGERYARGELWAAGRWYAGLSLSQEITPTLYGSLFAIANLLDPSALVGPGLSWSIADNADFVAGGYIGGGQRPCGVTLEDLVSAGNLAEEDILAAIPVNSEFGLLPATAYVQLKAYF